MPRSAAGSRPRTILFTATLPTIFRATFDAIIDLETAVLGAASLESVILRYGIFYGPGTVYDADGSMAQIVSAGRFPIGGGGPAHWSIVHVDDAATATTAVVGQAPAGVYNIVDHEPAPLREWLPVYAAALGAPPPAEAPAPRGDYGRHGALLQRGLQREGQGHAERLDTAPHHVATGLRLLGDCPHHGGHELGRLA